MILPVPPIPTPWPCTEPAIVKVQQAGGTAAALMCYDRRWHIVFGPVRHRP